MDGNPGATATRIQRQAANPIHSVVLGASAGSGKTKVLVDRFLRLCIEETPARAHPRSILAVTFTRKAAVEIEQRLLNEARALALAEPDQLSDRLTALFGRQQITPAEKVAAAGLYEVFLEDLSGLNVSTIHSFCQVILSRFAAEAGLDPHFSLLEDNTDLVDEAIEQLENEISEDADLGLAARLVGKDPAAVRRQLQQTEKQTMRLNRWLASHLPSATGDQVLPTWNRSALLPALLGDLRAFLFPELPRETEATVLEFLPLLADSLERFLGAGLSGVVTNSDSRLEKKVGEIRDQGGPLLASLRVLIQESGPGDPDRVRQAYELVGRIRLILLTKGGKFQTLSRIRKQDVGLHFNTAVCAESLGVLKILQMVDLLALYRQNEALLKLSLRLLDITDALKRRDRVIDFQDLEDLARRLMGDPGRALSLMHRLDDSLNHILLDEFQDTNFNQWDMLSPFVDEFLAGNAGENLKTVFVVGDVKQSIYGFRAAEPELFSVVEEKLESRNQKNLTLPTNFRSLRAVVESVGCVFNNIPLSGFYTRDQRESARQLWLRDEPDGAVYALDPFLPEPDQRSSDELAAHTAARLTRQLVAEGRDWGDILVLCRTRTEIGIYEKAFRAFKIPVVPAGRGMLAASREIQDLLALLRWLAYPADDIALATVLRSPIFRCSEKKLQKVLALRGLTLPKAGGKYRSPRGLWETLRQHQEDPAWSPVFQQLNHWRDHVGLEGGHDLLRRVYREGRLLEKYQQATGGQSRRNLLRLLDLSLSAEVRSTPTVRHLSQMIERAARRGTEEEAMMPTTGGRGRVRFMTIHGAKGLEAPVVLLVDADRVSSRRGGVLRLRPEDSSSPLLFKVDRQTAKGIDIPFDVPWQEHALLGARQVMDRREEVESANLLYVAMTRARDELYILGGEKERNKGQTSMLRQVQVAAEAGDCRWVRTDDPPELPRPVPGPGDGPEDRLFLDPAAGEGTPEAGVEDLRVRAWSPPALGTRYKVETPSAVDSLAPGEGPTQEQTSAGSRRAAMERGNRVHLLLQLAADTGRLPSGDGDEQREAAAVLANPALDWIFTPAAHGGHGLSEQPVIHRAPGTTETRITGTMDRLVLRDQRIDIIDYKTNRTGGDPEKVAELCEHYRPQMEMYRQVMTARHPEREIRTWLLFTDPALGPGKLVEVVSE